MDTGSDDELPNAGAGGHDTDVIELLDNDATQ
jgi:hypothetical protein